ncbi:expressed protein [Batrachochytrium dendrobatidis JAM81]|uniref:Expressed protein n=1 Tax=Batrachochytrium dendrobatidis (strain JAM81 / FGSC 10211) TaxID=684364 RepID=F4NUX6_BATDJ|nr:uncharacterized protein BATDEDRAFT_34058 [Batrachochytrium dendrobatidis JAM81]EGF83221.1 expressed protein [Batrachochytrium dendrobatidis JAM81]|eukprot:XP_006675740.1 expressed protein [Batrachochytrium dendrobatidis JAM81]
MSKSHTDVLVALEALKRHSFRAFAVLVARIVDDGAKPQPQVSHIALDNDLDALSNCIGLQQPLLEPFQVRSQTPEQQSSLPLLKFQDYSPVVESAHTSQTPVQDASSFDTESPILTPQAFPSPLPLAASGRRRGSITEAASNIVQRVRRLSVVAASIGKTVSSDQRSPDPKRQSVATKSMNFMSPGTATPPRYSIQEKASKIFTSYSQHESAPISPPEEHIHDKNLEELLSDHNVALLLGALCKAIFQFLEEEPAVALATPSPLPLMANSSSNEFSKATSEGTSCIQPVTTTKSPLIEDAVSAERQSKTSESTIPPSAQQSHNQLAIPSTKPYAESSVSSTCNENEEARFQRIVSCVETIQIAFETNDLSELSDVKKALWTEIMSLLPAVQQISKLYGEKLQKQAQNTSTSLPKIDHNRSLDASDTPSCKFFDFSEMLDMNPDGTRSYPGSNELSKVVLAIDHILQIAPRMDNQTVSLSDSKLRDISAAQLIGLIERLNRGATYYSGQRAYPETKYTTLNFLTEKIAQSAKLRLNNQCFIMTADQSRQMDLTKLGGMMENGQRLRLANQDWMSKEQRMYEDLSALQQKLSAIGESRMHNQRFELTPDKQRNMFIYKISGQIEKGQQRRMSNQDAVYERCSLGKSKKEDLFEFEKTLDRAKALHQTTNQKTDSNSLKSRKVCAATSELV